MKYVLALALASALAMPSVALAQSDAQIDERTMETMASDTSMQDIDAAAEAAAAEAIAATESALAAISETSNFPKAPTRLDIVIEDLDDSAINCGLSQTGLESAVRSALRYNRIAYVKETSAEFLHVNTITIQVGSTCVTQMQAEIASFAKVPVTYRPTRVFTSAILGSASGIISTPTVGLGHDTRVKDMLKELVDLALLNTERLVE